MTHFDVVSIGERMVEFNQTRSGDALQRVAPAHGVRAGCS